MIYHPYKYTDQVQNDFTVRVSLEFRIRTQSFFQCDVVVDFAVYGQYEFLVLIY